MTTTTTAKRSGKKRDMGEVVCHNCRVKGHYANKYPAKKPLPGCTTTKWCSLHKTRSHSDDECMALQATPQSTHHVSALPATISPAVETCSLAFVASLSSSSIKKGWLQLLVDSGCSSHIVDPEMIPNSDKHLGEYQALQHPRIVYGAGSHELLATGTAKLTIGVENTAGKQQEVNMSVLLVPGLGRNLVSSSAAPANTVETIISSFRRLLAKGEAFTLRADSIFVFSGRNITGTARVGG